MKKYFRLLRTTVTVVALFFWPHMAQARTWTSSDGSRSFEGSLRNYNVATGMVTVVQNGRPVVFSKDVLSEKDRTYLKEYVRSAMSQNRGESGEVDVRAALRKTKMGRMLSETKLFRVQNGRLTSAKLTKAPDYYILYYSASW